MSDDAIISVPLTQATRERLNRRAAEEGRSIFELLQEMLTEAEERCEDFRRTGDAIKASQEQSVIDEIGEILMDEINEEIELMHRERAELRKSE